MNYRSAQSVRMAGMGILSIAAVALVAAAIESAAGPGGATGTAFNIPIGGGGGGGLGLNGTETNSSWDPGTAGPNAPLPELSRCVEPLAAWYGGLVYFGAFGGLLYAFKRAYSLGAAFLGMYATAPVVFTAYFLSTDCASTLDERNPVIPEGVTNVTGGFISPDVSPWVVVGVFGIALVAFGAVLYRSSGDDSTTVLGDQGDPTGDPPEIADLAAAAGKAADRIEQYNADVDNAVYRAWWEMTSLLEVPHPESHTPGEFADAAVDLGMDECDVEQLTELFEEVRYGRRDAARREQRALDVLRNIEAEYGEAGEVGGDGDTDER